MGCREIQGMLTAYLEGALTPDQGRLVQEHLSSCEKCRCAADDLRKAGVLLKDLEEIEPPPWLTQKIMAHVRDEAEHKSGVLRWLFYPLHVKLPMQGLAAILIVGLAAFLYKAVAPQFEAAKAPREKEQVLQLHDRTSIPQREEVDARPPADGREFAKDAQQKEVAARQEAARQSSAGEQKRTPAKKSVASRAPGPAALNLRQEPPASSEESLPAYVPLHRSERDRPALPQDGFVPAYPKAKAPAPRSGGVIEIQPGRLDLTVRVTDIADAVKRIEKLLGEEGARQITMELREGRDSITAEMQSDQVKALVQKLSEVGDTRGPAAEIQAGETVAVRIDLLDAAMAEEAIR